MRKTDHMRAGGSILAGSIILGVLGGAFFRQPSIGFLAGTAVGLIALGLLWLKDRKG